MRSGQCRVFAKEFRFEYEVSRWDRCAPFLSWLKLTRHVCEVPPVRAIPPSEEMAKAMKAMKAMKKSVIAKGKLAKLVVFRGTKAKTGSGLKKTDLMKNKAGKIVSRKQSANGKKAYSFIKGWTAAVTKARKALGVKGFVAVKKGTPLYKKAKEFYGQ